RAPRQRYASAERRAAALGGLVRGGPTLARPRTWMQAAASWIGARPLLLAAFALSLGVVALAPLLRRPAAPAPDPREAVRSSLAAGRAAEFVGHEPLPGP